MKRLVCVLTALGMLLSLSAGRFTTSAQQAKENPDSSALPRRPVNVPAALQRGASAEARTAWGRLTPKMQVRSEVPGPEDHRTGGGEGTR
jgi:hypothetical protein